MYVTELNLLNVRTKRKYHVRNTERIKYREFVTVTVVTQTPFTPKNDTPKYSGVFFPDKLRIILRGGDFIDATPNSPYPEDAIAIIEDDEYYYLFLLEAEPYALYDNSISFKYENKETSDNSKNAYRIKKKDIPVAALKYVLFKGDTKAAYRIFMNTILNSKTKRIRKL